MVGMYVPWSQCLQFQSRFKHKIRRQNSGGVAVGRAVASDNRDPRFESIRLQYFLLSGVLKEKNKEKRRPEKTQFY